MKGEGSPTRSIWREILHNVHQRPASMIIFSASLPQQT